MYYLNFVNRLDLTLIFMYTLISLHLFNLRLQLSKIRIVLLPFGDFGCKLKLLSSVLATN